MELNTKKYAPIFFPPVLGRSSVLLVRPLGCIHHHENHLGVTANKTQGATAPAPAGSWPSGRSRHESSDSVPGHWERLFSCISADGQLICHPDSGRPGCLKGVSSVPCRASWEGMGRPSVQTQRRAHRLDLLEERRGQGDGRAPFPRPRRGGGLPRALRAFSVDGDTRWRTLEAESGPPGRLGCPCTERGVCVAGSWSWDSAACTPVVAFVPSRTALQRDARLIPSQWPVPHLLETRSLLPRLVAVILPSAVRPSHWPCCVSQKTWTPSTSSSSGGLTKCPQNRGPVP